MSSEVPFRPGPELPPELMMKVTRGHSCVLCQQRKVRCDKNKPCANCVKAKVECRIVPPQPPRRRKRRLPEKELIDRLRKYEALLEENGVDFDSIGHELKASDNATIEELEEDMVGLQTAASAAGETDDQPRRERPSGFKWWPASTSRAFRDTEELMRDSSEDEFDGSTIHKAYDTMFSNQDGFPMIVGGALASITDAHPNPVHIFQLWQAYINNVNPLLKVSHIPTLQTQIVAASADLSSVSPELEALMFSIYLIAATSMPDEEVQKTFSEDKQAMLSKFHTAAQQALINAGFMRTSSIMVLQAFFLYLLSVRQFVDPRALFCLIGIAVRIAQRLGLHRDAEQYGVPPFEVEQRRRLWWQLAIFDRRIGEMTGSTITALKSGGDCKMPLNVNDSDLFVDAKETPAESPGATEMLFALTRIAIGRVHGPDITPIPATERTRPGAIAVLQAALDSTEAAAGNKNNGSSSTTTTTNNNNNSSNSTTNAAAFAPRTPASSSPSASSSPAKSGESPAPPPPLPLVGLYSLLQPKSRGGGGGGPQGAVTAGQRAADAGEHPVIAWSNSGPSEVAELSAHLESTYLRNCDPKVPLHYFTLTMTRAALCKLRVVEYLCMGGGRAGFAGGAGGGGVGGGGGGAGGPAAAAGAEGKAASGIPCGPQSGLKGGMVGIKRPGVDPIGYLAAAERDQLFIDSIKMIEYDNALHANEAIRGFIWYSYMYFPFPAYMFLVHELRVRPTGDTSERAWAAIALNHERRNISRFLRSPMHMALGALFVKAWDARDAADQRAGRPPPPVPKFITLLRHRMSAPQQQQQRADGGVKARGGPMGWPREPVTGKGGVALGAGADDDMMFKPPQPSSGLPAAADPAAAPAAWTAALVAGGPADPTSRTSAIPGSAQADLFRVRTAGGGGGPNQQQQGGTLPVVAMPLPFGAAGAGGLAPSSSSPMAASSEAGSTTVTNNSDPTAAAAARLAANSPGAGFDFGSMAMATSTSAATGAATTTAGSPNDGGSNAVPMDGGIMGQMLLNDMMPVPDLSQMDWTQFVQEYATSGGGFEWGFTPQDIMTDDTWM